MSSNDLKRLKPGDLVEYQQPHSPSTTHGTFQRWYATDDGQVRLLVHHQPLGLDLSFDLKRVIHISHRNEHQS